MLFTFEDVAKLPQQARTAGVRSGADRAAGDRPEGNRRPTSRRPFCPRSPRAPAAWWRRSCRAAARRRQRELAEARRAIVATVLKMIAKGDIQIELEDEARARCEKSAAERSIDREVPHPSVASFRACRTVTNFAIRTLGSRGCPRAPTRKARPRSLPRRRCATPSRRAMCPTLARPRRSLHCSASSSSPASSSSAASPHLTSTLHRLIDNPGGWSLEGHADASRLFQAIGLDAARLLLPVVIVLAAAGILSSVLQNSPRLVLERIRPDLSRLSLSKGWTRIFGAQGRLEFLKAALQAGRGEPARLHGAALGPQRRRQRPVHGADGASGPDPEHGLAAGLDPGGGHHRAGGGRRGVVARVLAARAAHDAPGGQGRDEAGRRRSDRQGPAALAGARPHAQAHDRRGAAGHARDRQSDALCRGAALRARGGRRAAGDRQGPGPDRPQDPRDRRRARHSRDRGQGAGALALQGGRGRQDDPPEFYKAVAEIVFYVLGRQARTRPVG